MRSSGSSLLCVLIELRGEHLSDEASGATSIFGLSPSHFGLFSCHALGGLNVCLTLIGSILLYLTACRTTVNQNQTEWKPFFNGLFLAPQLRHLVGITPDDQTLYNTVLQRIQVGQVYSLTQELGSNLPTLDFSSDCLLQSFSLRSEALSNISFLLPCKSTLKTLELYAPVANLEDLSSFTYLTTLIVTLDHTVSSFNITLPPALTALTLSTDGTSSTAPPTVIFTESGPGSSSLTSLVVQNGVMLGCLPSNLASLDVKTTSKFGINFTSCSDTTAVPPLQVLRLDGALTTPNFEWDTSFTRLDRLVQLFIASTAALGTIPPLNRTSVEISLTQVTLQLPTLLDNGNWDWALCGFWNATGATTTSLSNFSITLGYSSPFPSCFATMHPTLSIFVLNSARLPVDVGNDLFARLPPSLTTFQMGTVTYALATVQAFPWATLLAHLPNIEVLRLPNVLFRYTLPPAVEPLQALMARSSLRELDLTRALLNGTIPSNFFASLPLLRSLKLSTNSLSGTVPGGSWPLLETLALSSNQLKAVLPFSAPKLVSLSIITNLLESFPLLTISSTPSLETATFDSNPNLVFELPQELFSSPSSKLTTFAASMTKLSGSFGPTLSPKVAVVIISNASLCGSLPELPSDSVLRYFAVSNTLLTGTIPLSYAQSITIDVSNNFLSGTTPSPVRSIYATESYSSVSFSVNGNTNLTGPLPSFDVSPKASKLKVNLQYTSLSWCEAQIAAAQVLNLNSTLDSCGFNLTLACACQSLVESFCPTIATLCSTQTSTVSPPTIRAMTCPAAAPPISPPSGCPGTAPTPQFSCVEGKWTSVGSVVVFTPLTVSSTSNIIQIIGNLTTEAPIVFSGLGTTIVVDGCVFLNGSSNHVEIELSAEELDAINRNGGKLTQTLISSRTENLCNGSTDLSTVTVGLKKPSGSCKKASVDTSSSTRSSLVTAFTIDNSVCNVIIIVPSVVGAVIVLTVAALIVFLVLKKKRLAEAHKQLHSKA